MQDRNRKNKAFSLIEILIVITIMAIVIGVVGSLLAGYTRMFNETDDQAVARQRAQDVFNALEAPIVNAALGIPTDSMGGYFDTAPIAIWSAPLEIKKTGSSYSSVLPAETPGNVLRLVYSIPSGVKNGKTRVKTYSPPATGILPATLTLTKPLSGDLVASTGHADDTRKFITFPNAFMSPLKVTSGAGSNTISVTGRPQPAASGGASSDLSMLVRGEVVPYHDIHLVRAIAAYVDSDDVFHAAEINSKDVSATDPTATTNPAGLRVEGIKAVQFEVDHDYKLLTVAVLAEGDIVDQTRQVDTVTRSQLQSRWTGVPLDDRMYYEDFVMTWRIRNYVPK